MDRTEWERELQALRRGELRLSGPDEPNRLAAFASGWMPDLKTYALAMEAGYRALCAEVDARRQKERVEAATTGRLIRELGGTQWSPSACLGYAAIGMQEAHLPPADTVRVLEAMEEMMACVNLEEAAEALQAIKEDRPGGGNRWPA